MEQELLTPEVRASPDTLDALLADEFIEFGSSGMSYDKRAIIAALADSVKGETLSLQDYKLIAHSDALSAQRNRGAGYSKRAFILPILAAAFIVVFLVLTARKPGNTA